jgi:hypothetical protein
VWLCQEVQRSYSVIVPILCACLSTYNHITFMYVASNKFENNLMMAN